MPFDLARVDYAFYCFFYSFENPNCELLMLRGESVPVYENVVVQIIELSTFGGRAVSCRDELFMQNLQKIARSWRIVFSFVE